jgi:hypothetical protein
LAVTDKLIVQYGNLMGNIGLSDNERVWSVQKLIFIFGMEVGRWWK